MNVVVDELMHQGLAAHVILECRDDIDVIDLGEFMALSREPPNVVSEGFTLLLPVTLQIPGVARPHIRALKVVGEDVLEILPAINQVSRQLVEPGPGHVGQVNGDKLDDEEVIILPTHPAYKAVVLQPNAHMY
jgi:hypothetical protein